MPKRKERILLIPICHLVEIITGQVQVCLPPEIPADSVSLRAYQDMMEHAICIVMSHASFTAIDIGFTVPKYYINISPFVDTPPVTDQPAIESDVLLDDDNNNEAREI